MSKTHVTTHNATTTQALTVGDHIGLTINMALTKCRVTRVNEKTLVATSPGGTKYSIRRHHNWSYRIGEVMGRNQNQSAVVWDDKAEIRRKEDLKAIEVARKAREQRDAEAAQKASEEAEYWASPEGQEHTRAKETWALDLCDIKARPNRWRDWGVELRLEYKGEELATINSSVGTTYSYELKDRVYEEPKVDTGYSRVDLEKINTWLHLVTMAKEIAESWGALKGTPVPEV